MTVPDEIVAALRAVCRGLPEADEEEARVGTRWRVRGRTFAHVLTIESGWPPAYARAAEAFVWLTDVAGLPRDEARRLMRWSAVALLRASLAEHSSSGGRPRAASQATFAMSEDGQDRRWLRPRARIRWWSASPGPLASDAPGSPSATPRHLTRH